MQRYGVLLCLNGTGILNAWLKKNTGSYTYDQINRKATTSPIGAKGLAVLPFGNGAERIFGNRDIRCSVEGLNFNIHDRNDLMRAGQEGIVYALNYGLDIIRNMGMNFKVVKAGKSNLFLSSLFREAFVNTTGATVELYNTDGAQGAARGAGIGAGIYRNLREAFTGLKKLDKIEPEKNKVQLYLEAYNQWLKYLNKNLS